MEASELPKISDLTDYELIKYIDDIKYFFGSINDKNPAMIEFKKRQNKLIYKQ